MAFFKPRYRNVNSNALGRPFGFTLLEVMVALAVMSIVLVSVYRMHSQSLAMNTAARFYTQAPMLAQSKMVEIEAFSSSAFPEDSGDFGEQFPGYGWQASIADVTSEILGEVAEDLKRVDITVSLNENQFVYTLRAYRFQRD
jgi:type II secretion system protein I